MKVLYCHNAYQLAGGEDAVLEAEMELMAKKGHEVTLALQDNRTINTLGAKVRAFLDVVYSVKNKRWMSEAISRHKPDVVHVHNFFPLLSPSIYDACRELNVPVVQTLHNYRTICAAALLMRDGKICEECITGSPYRAVLHRCYKDSFTGSLAVARMVDKHRSQRTWNSKVTRFIALTNFAKGKFVEAGFPADKIQIKSNFVGDDPTESDWGIEERKGALFVGRLSVEKGVATLLRAWDDLDITLRIAGEGPLDQEVTKLTRDTVTGLGSLDKDLVRKEMGGAEFLVMPSEWYEGFPMVLVEAFSQGLPVMASRLGGMAEIVEHGVTGLHFEAGNAKDLAEKARWMHEHPDECRQMGLNARKVYENKYTPEKNYIALMDIYQQAIDDVKNRIL